MFVLIVLLAEIVVLHLIELMPQPWIIDYTDDRNYTKMKRLKYKVIKEIKE